MSRLTEEKEEQAIRILEAMSGIDEDLLARCEQATHEKKQASKIVAFSRKYGKPLAACMCLAVLGTAFWGMNHVNKRSNDSTALYFANTSGSSMKAESYHEEAAAEEEVGAYTAEVGPLTDTVPEGFGEVEEDSTGDGTFHSGITETVQDTSSVMEESKEACPNYSLKNPVEEITAKEWQAGTGKALALPEGTTNENFSKIDSEPVIYQINFTLDGVSYTFRVAQTAEILDISGMYYDWQKVRESEKGYTVALNGDGAGLCLGYLDGTTYSLGMQENATIERLESTYTALAAGLQTE